MVCKKESVLERLKRLEEVLSHLETKSCASLEDYQKEKDLQWIIERGLEVVSSPCENDPLFPSPSNVSIGGLNTEFPLNTCGNDALFSSPLNASIRGLNTDSC